MAKKINASKLGPKDWHLDAIQRFVVQYAPVLAAAISVILLIGHTFWSKNVTVDGVSVALVALILIIPYLRFVRRIRFGEFEAEIEPEEVKRLSARVEATKTDVEETERRRLLTAHSALFDLLERDPVLALAKLRIDLDKALWNAVRLYAPERRRSIGTMARFLVEVEQIDAEIAAQLSDLTRILNRAVHGAEIGYDEASTVLESGVALLRQIEAIGLPEPVSSEAVSPEDELAHREAAYRVKTIIPTIPEPKSNVYEMTQEQLETFLEGYNEYAEYLVQIEPLTT